MPFIDPWSGVDKSLQSLTTAANMYRQQQKDEMAKQDWEFAKAERERKLADEMNLRAAYQKAQTGTKPITQENPAFTQEMAGLETAVNPPQYVEKPVIGNDVAELEGLAGVKYSGAKSMFDKVPQPTFDELKQEATQPQYTETTRPYSAKEQSNIISQEYLKQGKLKEAMAANSGILDMTAAIPKHDLDMDTLYHQMYSKNLYRFANNLEKAKAATINDMKMQSADPEDIAQWEQAQPRGRAVTYSDGMGGTVTELLTDKGLQVTHEKPVRPGAGAKYPGLPEIRTVDGKKMEGQFIFSTPEERDLYEKTGVPKGGNWENNFGDKSTTIIDRGGAPKEKSLTSSDIEKLEERRNSVTLLESLSGTFKPSYMPVGAAWTQSDTIGELENKIKKRVASNPEAAAWWQDWNEWANKELKKQSGAAVTVPEYRRFLQEAISSSSDPTIVTNFLARRKSRAQDNYDQMTEGLGVGRERAVKVYKGTGKVPGKSEPKKDSLGIR